MKELHPVSTERHADKRCKAFSDHNFAAGDNLVPLVITEVPNAVHKLPMAFVSSGDDFVLVAVQGLETGQNLLIDTAGNWRGRYFPEYYHCYPFQVAIIDGSEEIQRAVCIDEGSGLVVDAESGEKDAARFFEDDLAPSEMLSEITEKLTTYTQKQIATKSVCQSLQKHNLLSEWEISWREEDLSSNTGTVANSDAQEENSAVKRVAGLYCIDQEAIAGLSAEALVELRDSGALLIAFGQLYSMSHMQELVQLMQAQNENVKASEVAFDSIGDHGNISFDSI